AFVIFLDDPAQLVPVDAFECVLESQDRAVGQEDPFQRLFALWRHRLPDTYRPQVERLGIVLAQLPSRAGDPHRREGYVNHRGACHATGAGLASRFLRRRFAHAYLMLASYVELSHGFEELAWPREGLCQAAIFAGAQQE